jgi:hypothetical protein
MNVKSFNTLTEIEKTNFYADLKKIAGSGDPAAENMWHDDWLFHTNTLPYLLESTNRFPPDLGEFYMVYDRNEFIACGGVYKSAFDPHIALAGVRTWINKNYRNKGIVGDTLLTIHKQWAIENNCKQIALSFNDYNKNIINIFKRNRLGEENNRLGKRTTRNLFYNGIKELDFPVTIQYTKQWVIYEQLDPEWTYDWSIIEHKE